MQRLYRTLSELKAEVEGAIRSGRRVVERAGAEGARGTALSARIDALKELYNRLGARVTDAKGRLEGALVASREMHADLHALAGWLDSLAARPPRQTLELEMSRMEGLRDKLNATYAELERACPGAQLESLRAQVAQVNARWERLRRREPPSPPPAATPPPPHAHAPDQHLEVSASPRRGIYASQFRAASTGSITLHGVQLTAQRSHRRQKNDRQPYCLPVVITNVSISKMRSPAEIDWCEFRFKCRSIQVQFSYKVRTLTAAWRLFHHCQILKLDLEHDTRAYACLQSGRNST